MAEPITFGALVGLMVLGTDEPDTVRGVIRRVDEDGEQRRWRLARRGYLCRREELDGTLRRIDGADATWLRQADGSVIRRPHERDGHSAFAGVPIGGLEVGGHRPSWSRWDGTDFTRPTGPVTATEFLSRPAYAVELAPPSHKPAPIQLVVDAASGRLLRVANEHFRTVAEWLSVEIGVELPDDVFVWDGPAQIRSWDDERDERVAEHEADMARRRAWLDARGIARLPLPAEPELLLNEWDDASGAFFLTIRLRAHGALARRPRSDEPWPQVETMNMENMRRWNDSRWDWCLAGSFPVDEELLALLRVRLAETT